MGNLVLARRKGESIVIGVGSDHVVVTFVETRRDGSVRLAVEAPKHVAVDRMEIWRSKQSEKQVGEL